MRSSSMEAEFDALHVKPRCYIAKKKGRDGRKNTFTLRTERVSKVRVSRGHVHRDTNKS